MKRILTILVMFLPFMVFAEECDVSKITITSIEQNEINGNTEVISEPTIEGRNIRFNLKMYEPEDSITYDMTINNDSDEDYMIDEDTFKTDSEYIEYSLRTNDNNNVVKAQNSKDVALTVTYKKEVDDDLINNNMFDASNTLKLSLNTNEKENELDIITTDNIKESVDPKQVKNPLTSISSILLISILLLITLVIIYVLIKRKNKYTKYIMIILSVILIPTVYAVCKVDVEVESSIVIIKNNKFKATDVIKDLVKDEDSSSTDVITAVEVSSSCTNTLAYDGTVDNNLRYVGYNPCNYVSFNNELWRIIGVMNNVDDGTNNKETRIKIVRERALSDNYSWDSSSSDVNSGTGINDWTQSDLMNELNGDYLNNNLTENTYWYNGRNNQKTAQFDYTQGLKKKSQELIDNAKWYLGGMFYTKIPRESYLAERDINVWGSEPGQICNDGACPRATSWVGKVALMYPSDYGFAVGDSREINGYNTGSRNECLEMEVGTYQNKRCYSNDWIWSSNWFQWLLTPSTKSGHTSFYIWDARGGEDTGDVVDYYDDMSQSFIIAVRPVVYLKENTLIVSGNGSPENPYELMID